VPSTFVTKEIWVNANFKRRRDMLMSIKAALCNDKVEWESLGESVKEKLSRLDTRLMRT